LLWPHGGRWAGSFCGGKIEIVAHQSYRI
jgi:hypothetical protein